MKNACLLPLMLLACGSGDDGGGAGSALDSVRCGEVDTVTIDGTLDGSSVAGTAKPDSFAWVNLGKPSYFDGTWSSGSVHLEWGSTVADGATVTLSAARVNANGNSKPRTFQSGSLVYTSPRGSTEGTLKTALTFDTGNVAICIHRK